MKQTNEGLLIQAQTKLCMQNDKIINLQCLFMRENLVIKGIPEGDNESRDKTREKVVDLMKNKLCVQFEKKKFFQTHGSPPKVFTAETHKTGASQSACFSLSQDQFHLFEAYHNRVQATIAKSQKTKKAEMRVPFCNSHKALIKVT